MNRFGGAAADDETLNHLVGAAADDGTLNRFGGTPPRLKDALSATPTISLCEKRRPSLPPLR
ncbi:MAG: hypothetical protein E7639_03805 [Ruminococcaceae bacterium]|nr:hypothetical protein [Oscillospiraceae bacterium]